MGFSNEFSYLRRGALSSDDICIVDTPSGYAFYVGSWLNVGNEIGASSDVLLSAYDLPASLEKMELLSPALGMGGKTGKIEGQRAPRRFSR